MLKAKVQIILFNFKLQKMKTTKMSLANIQGKLSRSEMKNIMAGSGSGCYTGDDCSLKQSACVFAGLSGKARSTGAGAYNWKCCC